MTIAASAGLGRASARAGRTLWSPPQGDLHKGRVHRRARTARAGWALAGGYGPGIFRRLSAPATARCKSSRIRWGWSIGLLALSSGVAVSPGRRGRPGRRPRCQRNPFGGAVHVRPLRAGAQSRPPRPDGQTERATLSLRAAPQAGHGGAALDGVCVDASAPPGNTFCTKGSSGTCSACKGASSMYQGGCYQTGASNPGILSALLHQKANAQRLQRGTSSRQAQLQTNSPL